MGWFTMLQPSCALGLGFLAVTSAVILPRQGPVTALNMPQIDSFTPYTHFASAAYSDPSTTITWSCGADCDATEGFMPVDSGGDGGLVQFWYVGYYPALDEVIVAHEGTEPEVLLSDLTDGDILLTPLDPLLFPGISITSGILVHNGFASAQARSASAVLAAVQNATAAHGTNKVTLVGHSLGAALASIDAVYLPLHLPTTTQFKLVGYGMPRVGNLLFANYLDANFPNLTRINNKKDPIPILPIMTMGYRHPHGEIHITETNDWESCSGDENTSSLCSIGDGVIRDINDHKGPYNGIII